MDENKLEGVELNDEELEDVSGGTFKDFLDGIKEHSKTFAFKGRKTEKSQDAKDVVGKIVVGKQYGDGRDKF